MATWIEVRQRYEAPMSPSDPAKGKIVIRLTDALLDPAGEVIYDTQPQVIPLDSSGYFAIDLVANDDPTLSPPDTRYIVEEHIVGASRVRTFPLIVRKDSPGHVMTLSSVAPAISGPRMYTYALEAELQAHLLSAHGGVLVVPGVVNVNEAPYNAVPNDSTDATAAWMDAAAATAGGGTFVAQPGRYHIEGTIDWPSNTNIALPFAGAIDTGGGNVHGVVQSWHGPTDMPVNRMVGVQHAKFRGLCVDCNGIQRLMPYYIDARNTVTAGNPTTHDIDIDELYLYNSPGGTAIGIGPVRQVGTVSVAAGSAVMQNPAGLPIRKGMRVFVLGGGAGGAILNTTVADATDPFHPTLAAAAATTAAGTLGAWWSEDQMDNLVVGKMVTANSFAVGVRVSSQNAGNSSYLRPKLEEYTFAGFSIEHAGEGLTLGPAHGGTSTANAPHFLLSEAAPNQLTIESAQAEGVGRSIWATGNFPSQPDLLHPVVIRGGEIDLQADIEQTRRILMAGVVVNAHVNLTAPNTALTKLTSPLTALGQINRIGTGVSVRDLDGTGSTAAIVYMQRDFGAAGDRVTWDDGAMQRAFDAVGASPGGEIVFEPGYYRWGQRNLYTYGNTHLRFMPGAVVVFDGDLAGADGRAYAWCFGITHKATTGNLAKYRGEVHDLAIEVTAAGRSYHLINVFYTDHCVFYEPRFDLTGELQNFSHNRPIGTSLDVGWMDFAGIPGDYASVVSQGTPRGWWRLGESAGTSAADSSGNAIAGTYHGGITLGQTTKVRGNTAAAFDGAAGSYVSIPSNALLNITADLSIKAWVKTTDTGPRAIFTGSVVGVAHDPGYALFMNAQGTPGRLSWWDAAWGSTGRFWDSATAVNDGLWHHVVATLTGTTLRFYIDGVLDATITGVTPPTSYTGVRAIGSHTTGNFYNWSGSLDEVAVYAYALSLAQVQAQYHAGIFGATDRIRDVQVIDPQIKANQRSEGNDIDGNPIGEMGVLFADDAHDCHLIGGSIEGMGDDPCGVFGGLNKDCSIEGVHTRSADGRIVWFGVKSFRVIGNHCERIPDVNGELISGGELMGDASDGALTGAFPPFGEDVLVEDNLLEVPDGQLGAMSAMLQLTGNRSAVIRGNRFRNDSAQSIRGLYVEAYESAGLTDSTGVDPAGVFKLRDYEIRGNRSLRGKHGQIPHMQVSHGTTPANAVGPIDIDDNVMGGVSNPYVIAAGAAGVTRFGITNRSVDNDPAAFHYLYGGYVSQARRLWEGQITATAGQTAGPNSFLTDRYYPRRKVIVTALELTLQADMTAGALELRLLKNGSYNSADSIAITGANARGIPRLYYVQAVNNKLIETDYLSVAIDANGSFAPTPTNGHFCVYGFEID